MTKKRKDSTKLREIKKEELQLAINRAKKSMAAEDYKVLENMAKIFEVLVEKVEENEDEEKIRQFLKASLGE